MGHKENDSPTPFPNGKIKLWIIVLILLFCATFMTVLFVWGKEGNSLHEKLTDYMMYLIAATIGGYLFGFNKFFKK